MIKHAVLICALAVPSGSFNKKNTVRWFLQERGIYERLKARNPGKVRPDKHGIYLVRSKA